MLHSAAYLRRSKGLRYVAGKERLVEPALNYVVCVKPTPGLIRDRTYQVVSVEQHQIMGPLLEVRDTVTGKVLDAYYPWRFVQLGRHK